MISEESEEKVKTMASKHNVNIKKNNGRFNEGGRGTRSVESRWGGALFFFCCIRNKWLCRHLSL